MTSETEGRASALADLLYPHLLEGCLEPLPAALKPGTLEEAYRVQQKLVGLAGGCAGWKIAPPQAPQDPLCSPLPLGIVADNGTRLPRRAGQSMRAEVELAVTVTEAVAELQPVSRTDAAECIGSWHVAIEVLSSRLPPDAGWLERTADLQSSSAVVLGPPRPFTSALEAGGLPMQMRFDERVVGRADIGPNVDLILDMLLWLSRHARECGLPLKGGDVIITGARVKPVGFDAPMRISAEAQGFAPATMCFS
ncbi:MAG: hypothetical protein DI629_14355 [Mesorhizobium amorphae]|nr:MAG: hypothetical protein DI629_14355 [Mesorhizobium amorphae]